MIFLRLFWDDLKSYVSVMLSMLRGWRRRENYCMLICGSKRLNMMLFVRRWRVSGRRLSFFLIRLRYRVFFSSKYMRWIMLRIFILLWLMLLISKKRNIIMSICLKLWIVFRIFLNFELLSLIFCGLWL